MSNASALEAETEAEIQAAQEHGRKERSEATADTAPALVRRRVDLVFSAIHPRPRDRLLHLETLAVTSRALPQVESELGHEHPLVAEWRRLHDETLTWLHADEMHRFLKNT